MFFDNASTTKVDQEIINSLDEINNKFYFNPGSLYSSGRNTRKYIDECRFEILRSLNGNGRIVFTGSATEANNMALFGVIRKNSKKILVSEGEHPSVYNSALELKQRGYDVNFVKLNSSGTVDIDDFKEKMTEDMDLVSIMHVSNETGAINNIAELVYIAKDINPNVIFHCDGVQAVGKIPVDLDDLDVDMYTMSAHKIHGFKGIGALFVKENIKLKPIIFGGGQEGGIRSGTENIVGIHSLAKAIQCSIDNLNNNYSKIQNLKNEFISQLDKTGLSYSLHSDDSCSPYIISISFEKCRAETILNMMSDKGICIGNGSACSSKKTGNRILESMGVKRDEIEGNLRISFSKYNTIDEVNLLVEKLSQCVKDYLIKAR